MSDVLLFLLLILVAFCILRMRKLSRALSEQAKAQPGELLPPPQRPVVPLPVSSPAASAVLPVAAQPAPAAPTVTGETIAAISAAIALMMDEPFAITGISPAKPASDETYIAAAVAAIAASTATPPRPEKRSRPVWAFAGMQQNTRPF
ncbi:MAG: hypothetical protein FWE32_04755 [Oscillospiraceae bacterium]|nr:hypothetical protein [Oscillospiraceae bacterium]